MPTTTKHPLPYATSVRWVPTPDSIFVQLMPSVEVSNVPLCPATTKRSAACFSPHSVLVVGDVRSVQTAPSGDVRIVPCPLFPRPPTATSLSTAHSTPQSVTPTHDATVSHTMSWSTVTVKLMLALSEGEPLSVTLTVIVFVLGPWASVGVQRNTPVAGSSEAPSGTGSSKAKVSVLAGMSVSLALRFTVRSDPSATV